MHYSNRDSLTMSIQDKENIIWPLELGLVTPKQAQGLVLQLPHLVINLKNLGDGSDIATGDD